MTRKEILHRYKQQYNQIVVVVVDWKNIQVTRIIIMHQIPSSVGMTRDPNDETFPTTSQFQRTDLLRADVANENNFLDDLCMTILGS